MLEEIHKYLSGYIVQACENQTQETHSLFSFQKCCLNSDPWRSRRPPGFSICSPLFHFTAGAGFAGHGSLALSQQSGCLLPIFRLDPRCASPATHLGPHDPCHPLGGQ